EITAVAVGAEGYMVRTLDGGKTWTPQPSGTSSHLLGLSFGGPKVGAAVGRTGVILTTSDGGEHWAQQNSGTTADLQAVSFADPTRATAVGLRGTILRTEDGGTTWKEQYSILPNASLTGVSQVDAQRAYAVGWSNFGALVLRTTDGGANWARLAIPCDCDLLG